MVFFAHLFLLIYSSQKVPTSLKFYRALHILVLHMHRKFDVDSIDSFWDMEEQSTQLTRRKERRKKERKKEEQQGIKRTSRSKTRKVIITWWLLITGNKKNIKVKNKKSHHYMMTFNEKVCMMCTVDNMSWTDSVNVVVYHKHLLCQKIFGKKMQKIQDVTLVQKPDLCSYTSRYTLPPTECTPDVFQLCLISRVGLWE